MNTKYKRVSKDGRVTGLFEIGARHNISTLLAILIDGELLDIPAEHSFVNSDAYEALVNEPRQ